MLGAIHTETALTKTECHYCGEMSLSSPRTRLAFFSESNSALPLFSFQGPAMKNQRVRGSQRSKMSEITPAFPRVPHSLPTESFRPFSSPDHSSHSVEAMTARWTTACHWRLQMRRSCRARTMTPPRHGRRFFSHPV